VLPLLLALGLAACAAGSFVPSVGAPIFAVIGGVLLGPLARRLAGRAPRPLAAPRERVPAAEPAARDRPA